MELSDAVLHQKPQQIEADNQVLPTGGRQPRPVAHKPKDSLKIVFALCSAGTSSESGKPIQIASVTPINAGQ